MANIPILKTPEAKETTAAIATAFGLDPAQAAVAVDSLAAAINQRFLRNTLSRGGIADLVGLLADKSAGRAMAREGPMARPQLTEAGNHVLDVLIGNKHVSRGIAARTARDTGIDVETAKKLLPIVASMMVGGLQEKAKPKIAELVRGIPALQPTKKSPLPIPGDTIPGVNDGAPPQTLPNDPFDNLPDIIRRGGIRVPQRGASLEAVIRSILGSLLGNKNRGVIRTIIQAFILRWLANLARRLFSRIVLGR